MISTVGTIDGVAGCIWYSPSFNILSVLSDVQTGERTAYDLDGKVLSAYEAGRGLMDHQARVIGTSTAERILANIELAPKVISIARADMSGLPLEVGNEVLAKLQGVFALVSAGMFWNAAEALKTVPPDQYLTDILLLKYQSMLLACNAV